MNMFRNRSRAGLVLMLISLGASAPAVRAADVSDGAIAESAWARMGPAGKLVYQTTPAGDRIMDFSYAGYMGGGVALPDVPVKRTVSPAGGERDDTATIQAAIDEVSKLPADAAGFRGAVMLKPGTFNCSAPLSLTTSGVVLRGSGSGGVKDSAMTTIKLTGGPHLAISVRAPGGRGGSARRAGAASATQPNAVATSNSDPSTQEVTLVETKIADTYVPSGAMTFRVSDAKGLAVGDTISIRKPVTPEWVALMQMDDLTRDGKHQTWIKTGTTIPSERRIAAIDGAMITVDVPLSDSYDAKYAGPTGATVAKIRPPVRISQCGVEKLHIECTPQEINHTAAHFTALRISGQDCWARDLIIDETMNSVAVSGRRITLQQVTVNRKAKHLGASKPAEFAPNGTQVLLDRCDVNADNVWFSATGAQVSGPIVLLNCTFHGAGRSESHQRWSTGMLYDNCRAPDGGMELRNRGSMGSGHGWSMGWGVLWNCVAKDLLVQNPPGAVNWVIGCAGNLTESPRPFGSGPMLPGGTVDSPDRAVAPHSLYLTQLAERLGPQALKNIGYDSTEPTASASRDVDTGARVSGEIDKVLGVDLALHRPVGTSNARGGKAEFFGESALDGHDNTYWATDDGTTRATMELDMEGAADINALEIAEALGPRVVEYRVDAQVDSDWKLIAYGTTIGERKVDRFPKVTAWKVRLTILKSNAAPAIRKFGLYLDKVSPVEAFKFPTAPVGKLTAPAVTREEP